MRRQKTKNHFLNFFFKKKLFFFQIHPEKDVLESKLDLLKQTNMVDFATDVFKQLNPGQDIPEG